MFAGGTCSVLTGSEMYEGRYVPRSNCQEMCGIERTCRLHGAANVHVSVKSEIMSDRNWTWTRVGIWRDLLWSSIFVHSPLNNSLT